MREQTNDTGSIAAVNAAVKNLHNRSMSSIRICIKNSVSGQSKVSEICASPMEFDFIYFGPGAPPVFHDSIIMTRIKKKGSRTLVTVVRENLNYNYFIFYQR